MRKGKLFIIAILLLAIGSGATVYATMQNPDEIKLCDNNIQVMKLLDDQLQALQEYEEESSSQKILVQSSARCTKCGGSGYITSRSGDRVPCPGSFLRPCPVRSRR